MRPVIILFLFVLAASMILIPTLFVTIFSKSNLTQNAVQKPVELEIDPVRNVVVTVYRTGMKKIETYSLEEYVRGVVASEMPTDFEIEALKAQALAARTYIVKKIVEKSFTDVPEGAMVTDTVQHQVFLADEELKKIWGLQYAEKISKINKAINETNGQVITNQGKPITALFFSTSNGYTENSENYWEKEVSYLRSVPSPWDLQSPKYLATKTISFAEIQAKVKVDPAVYTSSGQTWIELLETTVGQRVKKIRIGDKILSGRNVREFFELNSSSFTWEVTKEGVVFHTKGYGHGVGMSQYGANGMALEGKSAEEIIKYYYTDVEITDIKDWVKPIIN